MLSALGAAHAQGLVHRDVKPGNILLTHDGVAKLADFGIAKAVADANVGLTATGEVMGTPRYLSPEQVSGLPATPRSDIYAVGVVMYEMLAGEPPFTGETPIAVALAHQREAVPSLAARRPGLDVHIEAVVTRALEKDPARRFASADEMRHALLGVPEPTAASDTAATVSATVPTDVIVAASRGPAPSAASAFGCACVDRRGRRGRSPSCSWCSPPSCSRTTTSPVPGR